MKVAAVHCKMYLACQSAEMAAGPMLFTDSMLLSVKFWMGNAVLAAHNGCG